MSGDRTNRRRSPPSSAAIPDAGISYARAAVNRASRKLTDIYGAFEDGANIWTIALYLLVFLAFLALGFWRMSKRNGKSPAAPAATVKEG